MSSIARLFAIAVALMACHVDASAQAYPSKPVSIVVPYPPGGVTDVVSRLLAQKLSTRMGVPFIVENRAGAGGTIGTDYVARAQPNGYTLVMMIDTNTIAPALYAKLQSDPIKDFAPITMVAVGPHIIVAHPSFGPSTIQELIDYAKQHPGESYASSGNGTGQNLGMEALKLKAGIDLRHIPYKGGGQAINDVVGGQVKVAVLGLAPVLPFLKSGQLKALAVTGDKRSPILPNVPTVAETVPGFSTLQWFAALAPAGTPPEIIDRLHKEFVAVAHDPEVVQRLAAVGLEVRTSATPADLTKFMEQDMPKWPPLVKAAGLKIE
jgi:tripartite-type tricarboxylate transporter receptor subunit TctC